ncbi:MAG TPA: cohesin domain-containing protein, partial [Candidatus Acidoferrales bacterium]
GAQAQALLTDSTTKILQNPEIRTVDGMPAKLRIGDRVPIATGSFQAGIGVGGGVGGGVAGVNPLVNTQFQYLEVGVNIDITPRIHSTREVSMRVLIEVSSVTGRVDIGGIQQPIISQRKIEQDIRLREGEVNVLGGILEESETKSISGWPGLSKIPFFRYFFSGERTESVESEVFIVLTPRIIRLPEITAENMRAVMAGTDTGQVRVRTEPQGAAAVSAPVEPPAAPVTPTPVPAEPEPKPAPAESQAARLRFEPATLNLKPGETQTIALVVENVKDLFSIPMLLKYDPAVISVEDIRHGGFLSGGTQEIAIVQRINAQRGEAIVSAQRQQSTAGVSGTGTLIGVVVKGVAAGTARLSVIQVNARDSGQQPIPLVTQEATIRVQP